MCIANTNFLSEAVYMFTPQLYNYYCHCLHYRTTVDVTRLIFIPPPFPCYHCCIHPHTADTVIESTPFFIYFFQHHHQCINTTTSIDTKQPTKYPSLQCLFFSFLGGTVLLTLRKTPNLIIPPLSTHASF